MSTVTVADLVVKTVYHDDVRRFKLSQASLVHLRDLISKTYEKLPAFTIKYTDPEGDVCSIGSDAELEEALNVSGSTLKLDILPIDDGRSTSTNFEKQETNSEKKEPKEDEGKQEDKKADDCCSGNCCGLLLELIRDKDIQAKLPEIAQSFLTTIEKGELNIKSITSNLFSALPSLRENPAVQKVLPVLMNQGEKINVALDRVKHFLPMILPMLKDLPQMIPHIIGSLNSVNFDDLKSRFQELYARACSFSCEEPASESDECGEDVKEGSGGDGLVIHDNIKCDGCGAFPITGDRFKCTVCSDFDLCSPCEQKNTHPLSHPLLKLKEAPRRDVHYGVTCDGCGVAPIKGVRFKCLVCPNYDLCGPCEAKNNHPSSHTLLKLKERKRGCGRFGPQQVPHHGFGHHSGHHGFGHHSGHHGFGHHSGHHGSGHHGQSGFGHHFGFGPRPHGLGRLFKGFMQVFGLNKFGGGEGKCGSSQKKCGGWSEGKCGWRRSESARSDCRRSESAHPARQDSTQGKCRRSRSVQGFGKCHGAMFKCGSKHSRNRKTELDAEFIQDVNFPDGSVIAPATTVIKQWRLKNTGSVTWPEGSKLIFLRGNRELLGETEEFTVPLAQAGESVDVSCPINVPGKVGHYSAYFKLADKDRAVFGHRVWIEFDVKEEGKVSVPELPKETREGKKEVVEEKESKKVSQGLNSTVPLYPTITSSPVVALPVNSNPTAEVTKYASARGVLEKMGFDNEKLNASLLERAKGNVEQVVTWLLEMENSSH